MPFLKKAVCPAHVVNAEPRYNTSPPRQQEAFEKARKNPVITDIKSHLSRNKQTYTKLLQIQNSVVGSQSLSVRHTITPAQQLRKLTRLTENTRQILGPAYR